MWLASSYLAAAWLLDRQGLRYDQRPLHGPFEAIVVAGCHVRPDGSPSASLALRTERAVELYKCGAAPVIIFSGGVGRFPPSEARAAADHARALGVPASALVLEDGSSSTEENARFTRALTEARRVLLVTDSYHALRAKLVFRRSFDHVEVRSSLSPPAARARGALREVAALIWYAASGRLSGLKLDIEQSKVKSLEGGRDGHSLPGHRRGDQGAQRFH